MQTKETTVESALSVIQNYRKQLNEVIDLMELCTVSLKDSGQHDSMWELLVAARSHADGLKQQLMVSFGLNMLYFCLYLKCMVQ